MKVKVLWGFEGDPDKVKTNNGRVVAGETLDLDDEEYAYQLVGKGLAALADDSAAPKSGRPAKPNETK
jgi:endonuclease YncB( thermonuclease family)